MLIKQLFSLIEDHESTAQTITSDEREGDMAHRQLIVMQSALTELAQLIAPSDDLPEWVQAKITLATDYITTVKDYLASSAAETSESDENR